MVSLLSLIIPVYNESDSLTELHAAIRRNVDALAADGTIGDYEIWFINDGSTDGSEDIILHLQETDSHICYIAFRRNFGKAKALQAGFRHAGGDVLITMDADLQDDPDEIRRFLDKLDEGYDLVSGWKYDRQDPLEKRIPSKLFNRVTASRSGVMLHDFNCGFKAYRREVVEDLDVYGEFHRYIPVLASRRGFRIAEITVTHHKRKFGRSKYGFERYLRGLMDSLTTTFLLKYSDRPMYYFGKSALGLFVAGLVSGGGTIAGIVLDGGSWVWALLILCVLSLLSGILLLSLGFLAGLLVDVTYHEHYDEGHILEIRQADRHKS